MSSLFLWRSNGKDVLPSEQGNSYETSIEVEAHDATMGDRSLTPISSNVDAREVLLPLSRYTKHNYSSAEAATHPPTL